MTIIELLSRWSELEPERCKTGPNRHTFITKGGGDKVLILSSDLTAQGLTRREEVVLCGIIEAAIVERGWWLTTRYQRGSWGEGVEWDCRICIFDECGEGNDIFKPKDQSSSKPFFPLTSKRWRQANENH